MNILRRSIYIDASKLQKAKTQVWSPTSESIDNEPLLRTLQGRMGDKRGILILGETVSEEPEDAIPIGNEAFVTEHIGAIKQKLLDDLCKLEHLPHKLVKGEAGLQTAWGLLGRTVPSRFLHVLTGHAVDITAELCDDIQDAIHKILAQWTDQGGLPHSAWRAWLPVNDLAALARLSALASLPENTDTHSYREAVINKEGLDLEARLQPKMETPPRDIVGSVHAHCGNLQAPHQILPCQEFQGCVDVC